MGGEGKLQGGGEGVCPAATLAFISDVGMRRKLLSVLLSRWPSYMTNSTEHSLYVASVSPH